MKERGRPTSSKQIPLAWRGSPSGDNQFTRGRGGPVVIVAEMIVKGLWLHHFRSIEDQVCLQPGLNVYVAPNEPAVKPDRSPKAAVHRKSWRTSKTEELITWQAELGRLKAHVLHADQGGGAGTDSHAWPSAREIRVAPISSIGGQAASGCGIGHGVVYSWTCSIWRSRRSSGVARQRLSQTDRQYRQAIMYDQALRQRELTEIREHEVDRRDFLLGPIVNNEYIRQQRQFCTGSPRTRNSGPYQIEYDHPSFRPDYVSTPIRK